MWYITGWDPAKHEETGMIRKIKPELLLAENIRTLLYRRRLDAGALAVWCGHGASWISKIINCGRGVQVKDLGRIADFFGLTVAQLFQHGVSELAERRKADRRIAAGERRAIDRDRRQPPEGRIHPDVIARFPPRRVFDDDGAPQRIRLHAAADTKRLPRGRP